MYLCSSTDAVLIATPWAAEPRYRGYRQGMLTRRGSKATKFDKQVVTHARVLLALHLA